MVKKGFRMPHLYPQHSQLHLQTSPPTTFSSVLLFLMVPGALNGGRGGHPTLVSCISSDIYTVSDSSILCRWLDIDGGTILYHPLPVVSEIFFF